MNRDEDNKEKVMQVLTPIKTSTEEMVFSNKVYLSQDSDFPPHRHFVVFRGYIFPYELSSKVPKGKIAISNKIRQSLSLSLIQEILVSLYKRQSSDQPATSLTLKIQFLIPPKEKKEVDDSELSEYFLKKYQDYYIARDQVFVIEWRKTPFVISVEKALGSSEDSNIFISQTTKVECIGASHQSIRLKSAKEVMKNVFSQGFTMESLGIGGLNQELTNIFRRAFASRRLPLSVIDKFGISHVKGILLYGPPGTGKTLIARELSRCLKAKRVEKVNGPEVFSKYVGESSENVRKLFNPAKEDMKKYGDQSPMHVIIFDEIDAICRKRGTDQSGTSAKDDVVNQLLTNLDGVDALNNIVVIGMTNRKDLIDEAILRPGRLEVQIEIGLPDEDGRREIFEIHTKRLKEEKLLGRDVNLRELAHLTKNFTGAEIESVVKNASSYAMMKGNDIMDFSKGLKLHKNTTVTNEDFKLAIEEIVPGFGIDQQNFEIFTRNPLINYGARFDKILKSLQRCGKLALSSSSKLTTVLLHGQSGTGKTSLAASFATNSNFTYVKIISAERFIGVETWGKVNSMNKVFSDGYKSKDSLIVIDDIEKLIDYVEIGPSFNNKTLQGLMSLLCKPPTNPKCSMLVICTTSNYQALRLFDMDKLFNLKLHLPLLTKEQCKEVLQYDIGIKETSIKKLVQFKENTQDTPKSMLMTKWINF